MNTFLLVTTAICALAAVWDYRTGLIPNWLTFGAIAIGVAGHLVIGSWQVDWRAGLHESAVSVAGLLFCALAPGALYWKGGMGGGDLKLFAAIGALCQPMLGIEVQMYALVVAAIIAPARLAYEGRLLRVLGGTLAVIANPFIAADRRRSLPPETLTSFRLGPAIFAGAALSLALRNFGDLGR